MVLFAVVVMARYRRARVAGGTYFFTVVTERRQRVLVLPEVRAALRAAIENVRVARPFEGRNPQFRVGQWNGLLPPDTASKPCRAGWFHQPARFGAKLNR